jgi:ABC-type Fe3+/spermidine/putrescine transport system ATPase subunit
MPDFPESDTPGTNRSSRVEEPQLPGVELVEVSKRFGTIDAVSGVTLQIEKGEFFSLLGPSGCGKTTLLRIVAGFVTPDSGHVVIGGQDATSLEPRRRPTAMVFQNYALFPNMTVGENVAYGLRVRKTPPGERHQRVQDALKRVNMQGSESKGVDQLSGGQQQRVALARALAVEPDVLLFDEPLSNLDVALREQTRAELKGLHQQLGTTSIYVTHDQSEALVLSDRIGVMSAGGLVEVGRPDKLFEEPETAFVASFLGGWNVIEDQVVAKALSGHDLDGDSALAVRPDRLLMTNGAEGINAKFLASNYLGRYSDWWIELLGQRLRMSVDPQQAPSSSLDIKAVDWRIVRK